MSEEMEPCVACGKMLVYAREGYAKGKYLNVDTRTPHSCPPPDASDAPEGAALPTIDLPVELVPGAGLRSADPPERGEGEDVFVQVAQTIAEVCEPDNPDVGWGIYADLLIPIRREFRRLHADLAASKESFNYAAAGCEQWAKTYRELEAKHNEALTVNVKLHQRIASLTADRDAISDRLKRTMLDRAEAIADRERYLKALEVEAVGKLTGPCTLDDALARVTRWFQISRASAVDEDRDLTAIETLMQFRNALRTALARPTGDTET